MPLTVSVGEGLPEVLLVPLTGSIAPTAPVPGTPGSIAHSAVGDRPAGGRENGRERERDTETDPRPARSRRGVTVTDEVSQEAAGPVTTTVVLTGDTSVVGQVVPAGAVEVPQRVQVGLVVVRDALDPRAGRLTVVVLWFTTGTGGGGGPPKGGT